MPDLIPVGLELPEGLGYFATRRAKRALRRYSTELDDWKQAHDECAERLRIAKTYSGETSAPIVLKRGEAVFAFITQAGLIEDRRGPGTWQGRSSGVSVPIGLGIRYRTGSSRGHYVQGTPVPTAIDNGTLWVTNQRAVFQGAKQTRECRFDKLIGYQHTPDGSTIFSVSNRQKPTIIHYGPKLSGWFDFRLDLALAHYGNDVPTLIKQLEADLLAVEAGRPKPPALTPSNE